MMQRKPIREVQRSCAGNDQCHAGAGSTQALSGLKRVTTKESLYRRIKL
jgi:hypothetical protein